MKIVIAIDSFKGSLSSTQAGMAIKEGIKRVYADSEITVLPVADGGEGTVDALTEGLNGEKYIVSVTGPLGKPVDAEYGIVGNNTAVIEMSAAAGITLVSKQDRNPLKTTTYGVGELICDAIKKGCRNFIIGIGGSATNDGGIGMLQALGYSFLDKDGMQIPFGAQGLSSLSKISDENVIPEIRECTFNIACDVTNPLCGEKGCSAIYGPQKGADAEMIRDMDKWLSDYANLAKTQNPKADENASGAGAAGGLGFAFLAFLNGNLEKGIDLILSETDFEKYAENADYVITGEGRLDSQTVMGKVPSGVAKTAKKYNVPVIAFSGCATEDANICNNFGIDAFFPILRNICTLDEAMNCDNAFRNAANTAEQVFRLIKICK